MGWPKGVPRKPKENEMPEEVKADVPEASLNEVIPATKEERRKSVCPWCGYENKDLEKTKSANEVLKTAHGKWQCLTCGKHWDEKALGKPYTEELEKGDNWVREMQARAIRER